jgi:hypothetical protein
VSRLRALGPLDAVEPKFVNDQQIRPRVIALEPYPNLTAVRLHE